jgi:hypothetical protein
MLWVPRHWLQRQVASHIFSAESLMLMMMMLLLLPLPWKRHDEQSSCTLE